MVIETVLIFFFDSITLTCKNKKVNYLAHEFRFTPNPIKRRKVRITQERLIVRNFFIFLASVFFVKLGQQCDLNINFTLKRRKINVKLK